MTHGILIFLKFFCALASRFSTKFILDFNCNFNVRGLYWVPIIAEDLYGLGGTKVAYNAPKDVKTPTNIKNNSFKRKKKTTMGFRTKWGLLLDVIQWLYDVYKVSNRELILKQVDKETRALEEEKNKHLFFLPSLSCYGNNLFCLRLTFFKLRSNDYTTKQHILLKGMFFLKVCTSDYITM